MGSPGCMEGDGRRGEWGAGTKTGSASWARSAPIALSSPKMGIVYCHTVISRFSGSSHCCSCGCGGCGGLCLAKMAILIRFPATFTWRHV